MERYNPYKFNEDGKENIQTEIKSMQDQISKLRDGMSREGISIEDKQKIKNQINSIENKITKRKVQLKDLSNKGD
jgi:flagellar biosynthesis chaperone FliJ